MVRPTPVPAVWPLGRFLRTSQASIAGMGFAFMNKMLSWVAVPVPTWVAVLVKQLMVLPWPAGRFAGSSKEVLQGTWISLTTKCGVTHLHCRWHLPSWSYRRFPLTVGPCPAGAGAAVKTTPQHAVAHGDFESCSSNQHCLSLRTSGTTTRPCGHRVEYC